MEDDDDDDLFLCGVFGVFVNGKMKEVGGDKYGLKGAKESYEGGRGNERETFFVGTLGGWVGGYDY